MSVDVTPIITAAISSVLPVVLCFLANAVFKRAWPAIVEHLGEQNALALQERVNAVLNHAIGFAVQHLTETVTSHGAITFETKNLMVEIAAKYATSHAPELMTEVGDVVEKVLARFDAHPAVQGLIAAAAANDNPAPPVAAAA